MIDFSHLLQGYCTGMGATTWLGLLLTHWGRVTHICIGNLTIIGPDNGLSPGRRQAFIWTNAGILLIGPRGTNFSEILIGIHTFSFKKIHLKISSAKWHPFCLGLNVLTLKYIDKQITGICWEQRYNHNKIKLSKTMYIYYMICCMSH